MNAFTAAYIECALWSSTDEDGQPLDSNYGIQEIDADSLKQMEADCEKFLEENQEHIETDLARAGHDFWLTRNHHGAGFWDGDWPEPAASILDKACEKFKEVYLYVQDGKVHQEPG